MQKALETRQHLLCKTLFGCDHARFNKQDWARVEVMFRQLVEEKEIIKITVQDGTTGGSQVHTVDFLSANFLTVALKSEEFGPYTRVQTSESALRMGTLSSPLVATIAHKVVFLDKENNVLRQEESKWTNQELCRIPVMNEQGYFEINGVKKIIVPQLKLRANTIFVFRGKKYPLLAEIRSEIQTKYRSTSTLKIGMKKRGTIVTLLPFVFKSGATPLEIGLKAMYTLLQCEDPMALFAGDCVEIREAVRSNLEADPWRERTLEEVKSTIGKGTGVVASVEQRKRNVLHTLENETLPHLGVRGAPPDVWAKKALFFTSMVRKLLLVNLNKQSATDRDHVRNQKCVGPGALMAMLFRQYFRNFLKQLKNRFKAKVKQHNQNNLPTVGIFHDCITPLVNGFTGLIESSFRTGNWSLTKNGAVGVVQQLNDKNNVAKLSQLRRVDKPIKKGLKTVTPRELHASNYGIFCAYETPEGTGCGLTITLAAFCEISMGLSFPQEFKDMTLAWAQESFPVGGNKTIYVDGVPVGRTNDLEGARQGLVELRRTVGSWVGGHTSIALDSSGESLDIRTCSGRLLRPLIVLKNIALLVNLPVAPKSTFLKRALEAGVLEYVDKNEEAGLYVARNYDDTQSHTVAYTHLELGGIVILGNTAALNPSGDHNQAPRNLFACAQAKATIGDFNESPVGYSLDYTQEPLVGTIASTDDFHFAGVNVVVAIADASMAGAPGHNQEDCVVLNRYSLDRGLFRKTFIKKVTVLCSKTKGEIETFGRPENNTTIVRNVRAGSRLHIGSDGLPEIGAKISAGDILIEKHMITIDLDEDGKMQEITTDRSIVAKPDQVGTVHKVVVTTKNNSKNEPLVHIFIRRVHRVSVGDKFTSRHGQKGTVGIIMEQEDMLFSMNPEIPSPDLLVSPLAFPSRMTIGQLTESHIAVLSSLLGIFADATSFKKTYGIKDVERELRKKGFYNYGKQPFLNGQTGEMVQASIFSGPTFYQALNHLSANKIYSREKRQPVNAITRQPPEGRSKGGGLRFGEMERDVVAGHGASFFLKDSLFHRSDEYFAYVCKDCGILGIPPPNDKYGKTVYSKARCPLNQYHNCQRTQIPYATKLLIQELNSMGINMKLKL